MIKVAIVDDHQLFRKSLFLLIDSFEGMEVVYDSDNGNDFLAYTQREPVDVVLLDIQMPILNGYQICKLLNEQNSGIKILIISQLTSKEAVHHVMDCGAHGFFTKNASPELLETAIHRLYHEGFFFDSGLSATIRDAIIWDRRKQYSSSFNLQVKLTEREIEVIKMVCKGSTTTEIAALYKISPRTVETHKTRLMKKLKVKNFIAVILFALKCDAVLIDEL